MPLQTFLYMSPSAYVQVLLQSICLPLPSFLPPFHVDTQLLQLHLLKRPSFPSFFCNAKKRHLCLFDINQVSICAWVYFWALLLHWSMYPFFYLCSLWQYHTALIVGHTGFMISLYQVQKVPPPPPFFLLLLQEWLAILNPSHFHIHFRISLSNSTEKAVSILIAIALKLWTNLRKTDIFIGIGLTILENSISIYLVFSFSQKMFVVFCMKVLHIFFGFIPR